MKHGKGQSQPQICAAAFEILYIQVSLTPYSKYQLFSGYFWDNRSAFHGKSYMIVLIEGQHDTCFCRLGGASGGLLLSWANADLGLA